MTAETGYAALEPRYFWRRAIGFIIDLVLALLLSTAILWAVNKLTGLELSAMDIVYTTQCVVPPPDHPQVQRIEQVWPLKPGEVRSNNVCTSSAPGRPDSFAFITQVQPKDGAVTYSRSVTYPLDAEGNEIDIKYDLDLTLAVAILCFVLLAILGLPTPGKKLFRLRAAAADGGPIQTSPAVGREILKLLPFVVGAIFQIWIWASPPGVLSNSAAMIEAVRDGSLFWSRGMMLSSAYSIGILVWWFGPFIVWRGRTWYDAIVGAKVVKVM